MLAVSEYSSYICGSRIDRSSYRSTKVNWWPFLLSFSPAKHKHQIKMEEEIWKDIPGWEGMYQVSNLGRARSLDREVAGRPGRRGHIKKGKILKLFKTMNRKSNTQYYLIHMACAERKISRAFILSILVCTTFNGPRPESIDGDTSVDCMHINGNSLDNRASNLKWGTHRENCSDPAFIEKNRLVRPNKRGVIQYTLDGVEVARYESIADAGRATGVHCMSISKCVNKRYGRKTAAGFKWEFIEKH